MPVAERGIVFCGQSQKGALSHPSGHVECGHTDVYPITAGGETYAFDASTGNDWELNEGSGDSRIRGRCHPANGRIFRWDTGNGTFLFTFAARILQFATGTGSFAVWDGDPGTGTLLFVIDWSGMGPSPAQILDIDDVAHSIANWPDSQAEIEAAVTEGYITIDTDLSSGVAILHYIGITEAGGAEPQTGTPGAATSTTTANAPSGVLGGITATSTTAIVTASPQNPAGILGALTGSPSAALVTSTSNDAGASLGGISATPAAAVSQSTANDSASVVGGISASPAAAIVQSASNTPATVLGGITAQPVAAVVSSAAQNASGVDGASDGLPGPAIVQTLGQNPTGTLGAIVGQPLPATSTTIPQTPSVILGGIFGSPSTATTSVVALNANGTVSALVGAPSAAVISSLARTPQSILGSIFGQPMPAVVTVTAMGATELPTPLAWQNLRFSSTLAANVRFISDVNTSIRLA